VRMIVYISAAWFLASVAAALFLGRLCGLSRRLEPCASEGRHSAFDDEVDTVAIYRMHQDPSLHRTAAWDSAAQ
jgi:hypothetical protein